MLATEVFRLQTRAASEDQLLSELAELARLDSGADHAEILLLMGPEHVVLRASTVAPDRVGQVKFSPHLGLTGYVLRTGEVVIRERGKGHPNELSYPGMREDDYAVSVFSPLRAEHQSVGVLILRFVRPTPWRTPDRQKLERTSDAFAICLVGWRRAYGIGAQESRLGALSQVTQTIATSPYVEEIIQLLVNVTAEQFGYKVCTVRLLDESTGELVLRATQAKSPEYQRKRSIRVGESIAGRAVLDGHPIFVADVLTEDEYIGHELAAQQGLRSMICVPLMLQERAIGVLTCYTEELHSFAPAEVKALETIAQQAAFAIERAKLQVRSTLMQEMHHRVKNNLQQVVSLLRLQLRHKHYPSIEAAINDSIGRILAISAVHDLLSREDLDRVDLKSIAESLVGHMQQSYTAAEHRISFEVRGDLIRLSMTQATQIALVLNELVQNALEHGFGDATIARPARDASGEEWKAEVHITFEQKEDLINLWVANNGKSLPADFDLLTASHLGLQIVSNLARALGGTFRLYDSLGWAVAHVQFTRATND